jgi:predicted phosphodiesterase
MPESEVVEIGGCRLYVLHDVHDLELDPGAAGFAAVIAGHSHRPAIEERGGVLFVNPGSAGPRRFKLPVAVARLRLRDGRARGKLILLDV